MSSDGSVMSSVSRIRQFGLYRSIDARTEEFLRASRKRQIRQGCACAAVSTAITVTVVVSVILVYEYSINGESNNSKKNTLKPNWIGFMNESTDVTQINSKFTKKINIDKNTMKLLPILIKALNTNRYLEKLLEDYSSTSPAYEGKDTTEFPFKKNVFDKRKWIKMPTSRLYTADYKSSAGLLKMPATNLDYFNNRRRKIDYQRMLNYFDKMVGDKMSSSQQVITNVFESTESPPSKQYITPPMKTYKHTTIKHAKTTMIIKKVVNNKKEDTSCRCPKNLGEVFNKLLSSLRRIIPNVGTNSSPCENKTSTSTTTARVYVKSKQKGHTWRNSFFKTTAESITNKSTKPTTRINVPEITERSTLSSIDSNIIFHKIYFPEDEASPFTPNVKGDYNRYYSFHGNKITTAPKSPDTITTENIITRRGNTSPTTAEIHKVKVTPATYTSTSDGKITKSPITTTVMPPDYDYYPYDTDNETTTPKDDKALKKMDNPVSEFVNIKNQSLIEESEPDFYWNNFKNLGSLSKYFDPSPTLHKKDKGSTNTSESFDNIIKMKHTTYSPPTNVITLVTTPTTEAAFTESRSKQVTPLNVLVLTKKAKFVNPIRSNNTAIVNKSSISITNGTKLNDDVITQGDAKANQEINVDNILSDIDLDKVADDELQDELSSKQLENIMEVPSDYNKSKLLDLWDILKYDNKPPKSMLPPIRPVYLEVQRNSDWRHDDHHDYDLNYNNNAFDMPNI